MIKLKNDELIEERKVKLLNKYKKNEKKIQKQKKENEKMLSEKFFEIAIKREDTSNNLTRYERQQELERQRKINSLEQRDQRLREVQRQKEQINNKKRELSQNVIKRKTELLKKVGRILAEGNYKSKDDIYFQVFNNEELGLLGKTRDNFAEYNNNIKSKSKSKIKFNKKMNKTEDKDTFFLTQGGKKNDKEKQKKDISQNEILQTK